MEEEEGTVKLTISEYIERLSKELDIQGTKGLFGNELELIALVRNCQFLYDKSLPDFKNIQKKNLAWEAIAAVFGVSIGEVQQRWKGMRDIFSKYKNKSEGNTTPSNKHVACPYYEYLRFLEPYIVGRRTRLSGVSASLSDQLNSDDDSLKEKDPASPSFDDLKEFIRHIKSLPILYEHKYAGGTFGKQKVEHWMQISKTFGVPVKECLARWRTLRERYSRERRLKRGTGSVKKWELYDELSFLDQHVKPRSSRRYNYTKLKPATESVCYVLASPNSSSVSLDCTNFLSNVSSSTKKEIPIEDVEFFDVSSDVTSSPTALFSEEKNSEIDTLEQSENTQSSSLPDEDDLFGQSIAAELRKVPSARQKIKLKAEIYRLLYEHTCE